ncbi:phage tail protein [Paenibacillus naphthalenovorans]|uniref:phage tail protein n=1 Tax=Paenibacillus naphthalenovorans TaxID=162209 RepID=UPI003D2CB2EB
MATVADLMVKINGDTSGLNKSMAQAEAQMTRIAKYVETSSMQMYKAMKAAEKSMSQDFINLANSSAQYAGKTDEYIKKIGELGKQQKKITDEMINNDERYRGSIIQSIGQILARSAQSEKIAQNFDRMRNPLYQVNNALLSVSKSLEEKAKKGTAAYLALQQLGPTASMKEMNDMITMINRGLMRMQMVALVMGIAFLGANYGLVQLSNAIDGRLIPAAQQFQASWIPVLQPFVTSWTTVVEAIIRAAAALGDFLGGLAQANPTLAAAVGWFGYLFIGLTAILAPLAIGIGLTGGLAASFTALWAIIGPFVVGFAAVAGTAAVVAAAIVALVYTIDHLWETNEGFRRFVITAWEAIKSAIITAWQAIIAFITPAVTAVVTFLTSEFNRFRAFWNEIWPSVKQAFVNIWNGIWAFLRPIVLTILKLMEVTWPLIKQIIMDTWESIKQLISGVLDIIMGIIKVFAGLFTGNWEMLWNGVKQIAEGLWNGILALLELFLLGKIMKVAGMFVKKYIDAFKEMADSVGVAFRGMGDRIYGIWEGIKATTKGAINFLISAINKFIDGVNNIKITIPSVNIPGIGSVGGGVIGMPQIPKIPALATGTNYVPKDTLAFLHQGEAVVPKKYNDGGNVSGNGQNIINVYLDGKKIYTAVDTGLGQRMFNLRGV